MSKLNIWIGTFSSEQDFEKYIDQSPYLQAWNIYNNTPLKKGEKDIEPSMELRSSFCKEIDMEDLDEDFLYIHYAKSGDVNALLSRIPTNIKKLISSMNTDEMETANAFICYPENEMKKANPEKSQKIRYVGVFPYASPTPLVTNEETRFGFSDSIWIGVTNKNKEDFLKYFDQSEYLNQLSDFQTRRVKKKPIAKYSCPFCVDIGVSHYNPERITVFHIDEELESKAFLEKAIGNKTLKERLQESGRINHKSKYNILVHLAQDETPNGKNEPKIKVYPSELLKKHPLPKGFVEEKEQYNGMKFIGKFVFE